MQINLLNEYYIEIDPMNYTLKEKYIGESKKTGEKVPAERVHGYFGTLDKAIEKFLFLNQIDCGAHMSMEMHEYVEFVKDANLQAVQAIKKLLESSTYDVDKVVEQIKILSIKERGEIRTEEVIDIVRNGGKE